MNELSHHPKCADTSTGLILGIYMLSYPKAVSDSMQKEIRHKNKQTNKKGGRNKKQDQQKNEISTETVMVNLFHETKKRKTHTRKCVRHNAEKYSLLLLCS